LDDARRFDELVEDLAKKAANRKPGAPVPSLRTLFQRLAIPEAIQDSVESTFRTMCRLHDEGRNHIWGYYVRNLARPVWLTQPRNRVDILIGNPPWLAFRNMPGEMQNKFREMSESRHLWHGAKAATQQDLSGLFIARVIELYLRTEGRFAFVMPNAALDRAQFAGFRTGDYSHPSEIVRVAFETPWDLRQLRPHFFPRGSAVVFGERVLDGARRIPPVVEVWKGRVDAGSWPTVAEKLDRQLMESSLGEEQVKSAYKERFRNGATVFPRVLFLVKERPPGPLGLKSGTVAVHSVRSANEKSPWKDLDSLEAIVESEFVYKLYLGEHVLPYRTLPPAKAVLPWDRGALLSAESPRLELFPGLAKWWRHAENLWLANRKSERLSLVEQLDYHSKLTSQYPVQPSQVVYTASGMHLAAAHIQDRRHVIEHKLYWATARSREEALFLCAILNSAELTSQARPLMSYGKDERDIDKNLWRLPIPEFDPEHALHAQLAALGSEVEAEVGALALDTSKSFVILRRQIRRFLQQNPKAQRIEKLVVELLS
jgi:hypothetical protein